ncbi:DNA polymerase IV [Haloglycomyces albus]|uniref:DNA polymerase IV n=1 Tax=Haloglycomyces albus TaxID=526067 RepID=UPI000A0712A9
MHVDMDAFFASVEQVKNPALRGQPVIVCGLGPRGVVSAASYEARRFGVHSAMPTSIARRRCPHGVFMKPTGSYGDISREIMAIFRGYTPHVQPLSVDEAFLDVSGARRLIGTPGHIAREIRARIRTDHRLTCTVGIASTPFLAKLASEHAKPDGLGIVPRETELRFLHPLPLTTIWGVGQKTSAKLERLGLRTVGDIAAMAPERLRSAVGRAAADHLHALAHNHDGRAVSTERVEKSISSEHTFDYDAETEREWGPILLDLSRKVAARARRAGYSGRGVTVKIRFGDFTTLTRSRMRTVATDVGKDIHTTALGIARDNVTRPVRLIGVRLDHLGSSAHLGRQVLLGEPEHGWRDIERTMDAVVGKWGKGTITAASRITPEPPSSTTRSDVDE